MIKNKESLHIQCLDINHLYIWAISQKLAVNNLERIKDTSEFKKYFISNYNREIDEGYFLEVNFQYLEKSYELHNDLPFLPKRVKIEKVENLVANLHGKTECVLHIRNLKQALNHGLRLKKVHRVIKLNQNAWLKPYIDMNTEKVENDFEHNFFKLMNNAVFGKTMRNLRKHRDIKVVTIERKRNYLVSELNYHSKKLFTEKLLVKEIKKTEILMIKPACFGLSILELSKILMYEFWYDYVKQKYCEKEKLCYMDTGSFIAYIKTEYIYQNIAEDVETRFETSNYEFRKNCVKGKLKSEY